jgi:hypothetical protein
MEFWRVYRAPLVFMGILLFSAAMVVRQYLYNDLQHLRGREDFIYLQERGHTKKAEWYYQRLAGELNNLSEHVLLDDYHRVIHLVDPTKKQPDNLIWKYYWQVKNRMDSRTERRVHDLLATSQEEP